MSAERKTDPSIMPEPAVLKMFLQQFIYCYNNFQVVSEIALKEMADRGLILKMCVDNSTNDLDLRASNRSVEVSFREERAEYSNVH